jgi:hypothetical protein
MPTSTAELGTTDSQLGQFVLGSVAPSRASAGVIPAQPALVTSQKPYLAHLYKNDGITLKKTFQLLKAPALKTTTNGGYDNLTIEVESWDQSSVGPAQGDVVKITQQGGDGSVIYGGLVDDVVDDIAPGKAAHQIDLISFFTELGDAFFNAQYPTATDVAQFIRDAVAASSHCWVTPESCPDTGVLAVWYFSQTNALEALTVARRLAGVNAYFFVDARGCVWFGSANRSATAAYTVKRGVDFNARKRSAPLSDLRNIIVALGGYPVGSQVPIQSAYVNAASIAQYGRRMLNPPLIFPTVADQATLDKIVATYGAIFDRLVVRGEITLQNFGQQIDLRRQGGATIRYWESAVPGQPGTGGYSPTYVVLDVEIDGPTQKVVFGDIPVTSIQDIQGEIDRIIQRAALANAASASIPAALAPITKQ